MSAARGELSPLQAYERAERQKRRVGETFKAGLLRLHRALAQDADAARRVPHTLPPHLRQTWRDAAAAFAAAPSAEIATAYRTIAMRYGLRRIEPASRRFARDLREFYRNYVINFPIPEEQESLEGFRALWKASPRDGGYEEVGYSLLCPLTGRYLMGVNFTIQPRSNTVHFIYGFTNPIVRTLGGFSASLIDLMRDVSRRSVAAHYQRHPEDRPDFHAGEDPLIVFEKNIIEEMSLTEILMDSAHVDIDRPPRRGAWLAGSAISQSLRDFVWDRRGGRIIDYNSLQSSLDGVVRVPDRARDSVIAYLNRAMPDRNSQRAAARILDACLAGRLPGCLTLNLCAFVAPGRQSVPAAQVRLSNEIFQGISVVKDPDHVHADIYFQAQMESLAAHTRDGQVALKRIAPSGPGARDFHHAEELTKRLLGSLSWDELRAGRDRTYGEWLRDKSFLFPEANA